MIFQYVSELVLIQRILFSFEAIPTGKLIYILNLYELRQDISKTKYFKW